MPKKPFKGVIKLDIRDSKPDWEPFMLARAPEGSPNILIVLYDDTGLAAWSPMGGGINMPTLQMLADALDLPHRPQSPPQRLFVHHGRRAGIPWLERPPSRGVRDDRPGPAGI